jgi:thymidylate synthase (FAD)
MKKIKASYEILTPINTDEIYKSIEIAGRTCYKSEDKITQDSAKKFVKMIVQDKKHLSVIEHISISVRFIANRGFTHELVRHRIGSYSQESTRYCNYSKDKFGNEITCIDLEPAFDIEVGTDCNAWKITNYFDSAWEQAEKNYNELVALGCSPQMARNVLPIGLKTEIVATYNLRQWREVFKQRTAPQAHPNMRELMIPLLKEFAEKMPEIFGDMI